MSVLFLSYSSADRTLVTSVRTALATLGVETFLDQFDLTPGLSWFDEIERALDRAAAVAVFVGPHGLGTIQRREMHVALDRQARHDRHGRTFPVIPVLLDGGDPEHVTGFLALNTWVDLRGWTGDPLALDPLLRAVRRERAEAASSAGAVCPYRELRPFHEEDEALFFGRERFASDLQRLVTSRSLVTVIGGSGSGKTSVIEAGLMPLLRSARPPADVWHQAILSPGSQPYHRLAAALLDKDASPPDDSTARALAVENLASRMANGEMGLGTLVTEIVRSIPGTTRMLLVVDQFEELFTIAFADLGGQDEGANGHAAPTLEASRVGLITYLLGALTSSPLTLVLAIRADYLDRAVSISRPLSELMESGLIILGPMTDDELRRAVEQPASCTGVRFEEGLLDRILDDAGRTSGSLPLIEFALTRLWSLRREKVLTHAAYEAIGRVHGAIAQHAEATYLELPQRARDAAQSVLTRFVRINDSDSAAGPTRQPVILSDLHGHARAIVQPFIDARLLFVAANQPGAVELAHEAILVHWTRLRRWIDEDRAFLAWLQRVQFFMAEWQRARRSRGLLLRGVVLEESRAWSKSHRHKLNAAERRYVNLSIRRGRLMKLAFALGAAAAAVVVVAVILAGITAVYRATDGYQVATAQAIGDTLVAHAGVDLSTDWLLLRAAETGAIDPPLALLREARDEHRARVLGRFARRLAEGGRTDWAERVLREARASQSRASTEDVIVTLAAIGQSDAAVNLIRKEFPGAEGIRYDAAAAYVRAEARAGRVTLAVQKAKELFPSNFAGLILQIAPIAAEVNQTTLALDLARELREYKTPVYAHIAIALAQANRADELRSALDHVDLEKSLGEVGLLALIETLEAKGFTAGIASLARRALPIARAQSEPYFRHRALEQVAAAYAAGGDLEAALRITNELPEGYMKAYALAKTAVAFKRSGDGARADSLADGAIATSRLDQGARNALGTSMIATELIPIDGGSRAIATASEIRNPKERSIALWSAGIELLRLGQVGRAREAAGLLVETANAWKEASAQSETLARAGRLFARAHEWRRARVLAARCASLADRLSVLAAIVRASIALHRPEVTKLVQPSSHSVS